MSLAIKLILQSRGVPQNNKAKLLSSFSILILSAFLSFINEPFNIQMVLVLLGILIYEIITKKKSADLNTIRNITISVVTILACTVIMIKAPGTNIRTSMYRSGQSTTDKITLNKSLSFAVDGSIKASIKFIKNNYPYLITIYLINDANQSKALAQPKSSFNQFPYVYPGPSINNT
jgi:hypothetical protein